MWFPSINNPPQTSLGECILKFYTNFKYQCFEKIKETVMLWNLDLTFMIFLTVHSINNYISNKAIYCANTYIIYIAYVRDLNI